jgi:molybdate transport system substrate-binding protein
MHSQTTRIALWLASAVLAMGAGTHVATVTAAEVAVLSAGALQAVLSDLAGTFQQETGHAVRLSFGTAGEVQKRVAAGEATDVVIATNVAMEQLAGQGLVVPDTRTVIARVGIGVCVREGAPKPDISSTETFKQTLLAAKSVIYYDPARGAAAIHFARVIERLGIAQAIKNKAVLIQSGAACEPVAKGEVELGVTQISEILPVKGVTLVGPFPRDVQNVTTFAVALFTRANAAEAARAFFTFLTRPAFRTKFADAGLDFRQE